MSLLTRMYFLSLRTSTGKMDFTRSRKDFALLNEFRKLHLQSTTTAFTKYDSFPSRQNRHGVTEISQYYFLKGLDVNNVRVLGPLSVSKSNSKRMFSAETYSKYFSPDVAPIGFAQKVLESIHSATGLPWWASIALSTVVFRGTVTVPLAIYSMRIMSKVELLQPEIGKLSQELRREVAVAVKKFAWDAKYARFKYNSTMRRLIKDLYIRDNCHPAKSSLVLWFQIPLWVCLSFALRNMSGAVPMAANSTDTAVLCSDLKSEGILWFPDLTAADGTWILPVLLGAINLLNIEMHTLSAQQVSKFQKYMVFVMRLLSLVMVPIGAVVPSCMCYYWLCSSLFGLGQNILLKVPSVRRLMRLPKTPSESQMPFRDMYNSAKLKYIHRSKQSSS